ncbi:hypothetical protein FE257_009832 [Aspergillus nanangensis]|uniref:Uncharacterized protein n=1 Tax=Aspergillus nanangensis TaxID=2582783 RepID=A0AAD4CVV7_ASPNN|nr:hypothetical protein FE257_009832 [Aspergillus nanangensis]
MGGSSPPFLYGTPSSYNFHGPTDRPFNPKAVTQASWTRPPSKEKPKGPLVDFNRHPDSYSNIPDGSSRWTPMSPRTKGKVVYGRKIQLGLRVLALIGALGSLFCAIIVKNVPATIVWIIRVAPGVAILHLVYGIYHLCRSPITRPPGSQASYMLFASILDLGLIPFYVFSAYLGYMQYVHSAYEWGTMLGSDIEIVTKIAQATFLLSVINGGLHLISLGICIFLGILFREISKLPPDLNPLEDNLTARRHKLTKTEMAEKHASQTTLDSAMSDDPLMGSPRKMAFMHTRGQSSGGGSTDFPHLGGNRESQTSLPSIPQMPFHQTADPLDDMMYHIPEHEVDIFTKPTSTIPHGAPVREPSPQVPSRSQCASPDSSENWVAFESRDPSLMNEVLNDDMARRDPSSVYSRGNTPASHKGGMLDWVTSGPRTGWGTKQSVKQDHGQYESVPIQEYYGNDDDDQHRRQTELYDSIEQDIGDNRINIYQDQGQYYDDYDVPSDSLRVNPLGMNPPTPQPILNDVTDDTPLKGRPALAAIPNLSPTPPVTAASLIDSPEKNGRFYGELEGKSGLNIPRNISNREGDSGGLGRKKSKLIKRQSQKKSTYGALKQNEDGVEAEPPIAATAEGDRTGRIVSNSGADIGHHLGTGSSLSYGKYIAGLGVGRRRDVSGKVAEEGRAIDNNVSDTQTPSPIRAAGWARFAGL